MSLHDLAHQIRAKGRGDDTMLIHMTPGEVHGLQSLALAHGGSLTINPDTGLPEAGILKSLLPTLIGVALAPLTAGTSLAFLGNPLVAGALVGGVEGLRTGSIEKGLMAGLGAYGGAGLGAGLAGVGATAKAAALPSGVSMFPGAASSTASEALKTATKQGLMQAGKTGLQQAGTTGARFGLLGEGAKNIIANPMSGIGALGRAMGPAGIAGVGSTVANAMTPAAPKWEDLKKTPSFYKTTYNPGMVNPRFGEPGQSYFVGQGYGPGTWNSTYQSQPSVPATSPPVAGLPGLADYMQTPMYAEGGPISMPQETFPMSGVNQPGYSQPLNFARPTEPMQDYEPRVDARTGEQMRFAGGGLTSLGSYSDGGQLLKGPGDGMSDDIPAVIGGEEPQKAALADGEFVVPADVVSGIGNGSTEAGSRKLYEMMDRVRMARTGREKQAPAIDADKLLPA
jgi:hypothetical protein